MRLTNQRRAILAAIRDGHSRRYANGSVTLNGRRMNSDWWHALPPLFAAGWLAAVRATGSYERIVVTQTGCEILGEREYSFLPPLETRNRS